MSQPGQPRLPHAPVGRDSPQGDGRLVTARSGRKVMGKLGEVIVDPMQRAMSRSVGSVRSTAGRLAAAPHGGRQRRACSAFDSLRNLSVSVDLGFPPINIASPTVDFTLFDDYDPPGRSPPATHTPTRTRTRTRP